MIDAIDVAGIACLFGCWLGGRRAERQLNGYALWGWSMIALAIFSLMFLRDRP